MSETGRGYAYWNTPDKTGVTRRQRKWAEKRGVPATLEVLSGMPCLEGHPLDGPVCTDGSCVTCEARGRVFLRSASTDPTYRQLAAATLVAHQRKDAGSCLCGWSELGKSHAEHVARVLDDAGALRRIGQ